MAKKKLYIGLVVALAFLLVVSIAFGISFAYYTEHRSANGKTIFDKGIYVQISNLSNNGNLYYNNGSGNTVFSGVSCEPNSTFSIVNPSLNVLSSSLPVYARAKLKAKFYVNENNQSVEKTYSQLGAVDYNSLMEEIFSSLPTFNSNWQESADGYYYYCQTGKTISRANLQIINANSNSGNIFSSTSLEISDYEVLEGAPHGISKIELFLLVDVIQSDGVSAWNPLEVGTLDVRLYTLKNSNATQVIDLEESLIANTTYTLVENATGYGYKFTYANNNGVYEVTITEPYNNPTSLAILNTFKWNGATFTTTSFGDYVFSYCSSLTSVTIPNSVTSIGDSAFEFCSSLTSIIIPSGVTNIGDCAFSDCTGLTNIIIPSSVTNMGDSVFAFCSSLASVTISSGVTSIGNSAFRRCSGLTSITIPSSVTSIGDSAFVDCSGLTSITIPSSVTSIENSAFYGCSGLTSITIPSSVTSIEDYVFYDCSGLTNITIPSNVTSIGWSAFYGCSGLTSITIPSSVTSIESSAFRNCTNLATLVIDSSYVADSNNDSYLFTTATTVYVKDNLSAGTYITSNFPFVTGGVGVNGVTYTKYEKSSLYTLKNSDASATISSSTSLVAGTTYTLVENATGYGYKFTYANNNGVNEVTITAPYNNPTSLAILDTFKWNSATFTTTSIGDFAFLNCPSLTSITIPNSVTSIGDSAFRSCSGLTNITIPSSVTSIGDYVFSYCSGLTSITIPSSVTSIGNSAFQGCTGLQYTDGELIYIKTTTNNHFALFDTTSTSITTATIDLNCKFILDSAFAYCSSLTSITIPSSVISIGVGAFYDCTNLATVYIDSLDIAGLNNDDPYLLTNATTVYVKAGLTAGTYITSNFPYVTSNVSINGGTYTRYSEAYEYTLKNSDASETISSSTSLIAGTTYTLVENATGYGYKFTYAENNGANEITVTAPYNNPTSLAILNTFNWNGATFTTTAIGTSAFLNYPRLTSIIIPNSVTIIGDYAFLNCPRLTSITIPSSVTTIGVYAFRDCSSLDSFIVDSGNTTYSTLDNGNLLMNGTEIIAFAPYGITNITIPSGVTSIGNNAFSDCSSLKSITIPSSVTSIGNNAFSSCSGLTSITIPSSVTLIGNNAFSHCSGLTSITIPSSVTSIGNFAFDYCTGLTSITIPSSVTSIESSAFYGCSGLTNITIPSSVTSIGYSAFSGCSGLTSITIPSSVTSIGSSAFHGCTNLATVIIDSSYIADSNNDSYLFTNATTVYVKDNLSAGTYITTNFPYVTNNVSINGGTYTRYSKTSS